MKKTRREVIMASVAASVAITAGCTGGEENGDGGRSFTAAGLSGENQEWDQVQPQGHDELIRRIESESDSELVGEFVGESQLCGEETCPETVQEGVVQIGYSGIGNSTNTLPQNDIFAVPYTFEQNEHLTYTLCHDEIWEDYWVPFAQQHGVLPVMFNIPHLKHVLIGTDTSNSSDEPFRVPSDIEGLSMRRTESSVAGTVFETWGADPENVSWGDTVQGLQSGVVDGQETWLAAAFGFGMREPTGEVIVNGWGGDVITAWANVDWLQSLDSGQLDAVAKATRSITEDQTNRLRDVHENRHGLTLSYEPLDNPPSDSVVAESTHIDFNVLDDDEINEWREPVEGINNLELYEDVFSSVDNIGVDGESLYETIYDIPRESGAPTDPEDFSVDSWWIDYLNEI